MANNIGVVTPLCVVAHLAYMGLELEIPGKPFTNCTA